MSALIWLMGKKHWRKGKECGEEECCKKIIALRRMTWIVWSVALLLSCLLGLFAGLGYGVQSGAGALSVLIGLFSMTGQLRFAFHRPELIQIRDGAELGCEDFPEIFRLVREEAARCGHARQIRVFMSENGTGAFRERKFDGILLPPAFVSILTKDEFRQVLRHEFAHLMSVEMRRELRWNLLSVRHAEMFENGIVAAVCALPLIPFLEIFEENKKRYRALTERSLELQADACERLPEEARDAVAAMAKAEFYARFCEAEQTQIGVISRKYEFEKMLDEYSRVWLEELKCEAAKQSDTHPAFSERCKASGVTDFDPFGREDDEAWINETDRLCDRECEMFSH